MAQRSLEEVLQDRINRRKPQTTRTITTSEETLSLAERLEARIKERQLAVDAAARKKKQNLVSYEESAAGNLEYPEGSGAAIGQNIESSYVSGMTRILGDIATAPLDFYSWGQESGIPDKNMDAYARQSQNKKQQDRSQQLQPNGSEAGEVDMSVLPTMVKQGDEALLNERVQSFRDHPANHPMAQAVKADKNDGTQNATVEGRLDRAIAAREIATSINDQSDMSEYIYKADRNQLSEDLRDEGGQRAAAHFETAKEAAEIGDPVGALKEGLKGVVAWGSNTIGAANENKVASLEYIVENIPQIALHAVSKPLAIISNLGYGIENHRIGIKKFREENEGRWPDQETRETMFGAALAAALADQVGDASILKAIMPKRSVTKASITGVLAKPVSSVLKPFSVEAVTEGAQTKLESVAKLEEASTLDILEGGSIGAIAAGGMSAPTAATDTLDAVGEVAGRAVRGASKATEGKGVRAQRKAVKEADESGDVSVLLDRESPAYAPDKAVEVLNRQAESQDITPERREELGIQADKVVGDMTNTVEELKEAYNTSEANAEDVLPTKIAEGKTKLGQLTVGTSEHTAQQEKVEAQEQYLTDLKNDKGVLKRKRAKARSEYQKAERDLLAATEVQKSLRGKVEADTEIDVDAEIVIADSSPKTEGAVEAADKVIKLAMATPDRVTPEQATKLADNTANSLSESQRGFLRSYSAAQQAKNELLTMDGVNTDVMEGNTKERFVGVNQYRDRFNTQMRNKDSTGAQAQLTGIKSFADQREQKAAVIAEGLAEINDSEGKTKRVDFEYNKAEGKYQRKNGIFASEKARAENGGLIVTARKSGALLAQVNAEAKAVRSAANEMDAAYKIFNESGTASQVNTDTPAANDGQASVDATTEVPATLPADVNATTQQDNTEVTPASQEKVTLTRKNKYTSKDQAKSDKATKFIGRGSKDSSTDQYAKDWGDRANTGEYTAEDTVFVNAEGQRKNRKPLDTEELGKATQAGATVITDDNTNRQRPYNSGEREAAAFLTEQGYTESKPGTWTPSTQATAEVTNDTNQNVTPADAITSVEEEAAVVPAETSTAPTTEPTPTTDGTTGTANTEQEATPAPEAKQETGKLDTKKSRNTNAGALRQVVRSLDANEVRFQALEKDENATKQQEQDIEEELDDVISSFEAIVDNLSNSPNKAISDKAKQVKEDLSEAGKLTKRAEIKEAVIELGTFIKDVEDSTVDMFNQDETGTAPETRETGTGAETNLSPDTPEPTNEVTVEEEIEPEVDEQTGEIIDGKPAQNNDAETNGEGQLSLFEDAAENRTVGQIDPVRFKEANLIKEYLRQDQRDLSKRVTKRPLVEIRNFLSQLLKNKKLAQNFVSEKLTSVQEALVDDMASRLSVFNESVVNSLPAWAERSPEFRYQDYIGYFRDDVTGEMDENVTTAISAGMYRWLADNAGLRYHDKRGVNILLSRDSKQKVKPAEYAAYGKGWYRQNHVQNEIGKGIADSLGLTKDNGVPMDMLEKIHGALGGRALAALQDQGIVETKVVTEAEAAAISERDASLLAQKHEYMRVVTGDAAYGRMVADEIVAGVKGSQSLLPKLFGVEDKKTPPTFKPVAFKNRKPKRSSMLIAKAQEVILNQYNKLAYYVEKDVWNAWEALDTETQVIIAGGKDMNEPIHVANYAGHEGANDALKREAADIREFVGTVDGKPNGKNTPFFFDWVVWKMGRMGINGSMVNPQTSKIHRGLVKQAEWTETAEIDNTNGTFDDFLLAIADGLGVATDSDLNVNTLEAIRTKIAEAGIENGVIAIMKSRNNEPLNDSDKAAIKTAVKMGGEDMHSFQALVALSKYLEASERGETSFTYTAPTEIDGKTNGPMLTQWLLGAASTAAGLLDVVVRGGFFTPKDGVKHIGDWARHKHNHDLYQRVAKVLNSKRAETLQKKPELVPLYSAIDFFIGEPETSDGNVSKHARKMVKDAVNPLNFGSGLSKIVEGMSEVFIDGIYKKIEDLAKMPEGPERVAAKSAVINNMNQFLRGDNQVPKNASIESLLKFEIKGKARDGLMFQYKKTFGEDIKETLGEVFGPLIDRRESVNHAATMAFTLYDAAYRFERQKYIREVMASGTIGFESKTNKDKSKTQKSLLQDLTPDQEAEIRKRVEGIRPVVNTAFSRQEENLDAGLMLAKQENMTDGTFTYMNTTKINPIMRKNTGIQNKRTQGKRQQQVDPGLGTVIWQVHSTDAFIAATTFAKHNALNVHDAEVVAPSQKAATARTLNQQTFEAILTYSPPQEVLNAYLKTLGAFVEYARENDMLKNPQVKEVIQKGLDRVVPYNETGTPETIVETVRSILKNARQARLVSLEALSQLSFVSQYTAEGGHYELTEADYKRIEAEIKKALEFEAPEGLREQLSELMVMMDAKPLPSKNEVEQQKADEAVSAETPTNTGIDPDAPQDSSDLGAEVSSLDNAVPADVDQEMLRMLEATEVDNTVSTEEDVVNKSTLQQLLKVARKGAPKSYAPLLDRIEALLPKDFSTETVTDMGDAGQYRVDGNTKQGAISINVGFIRRAVSRRLAGNTDSSDFSTTEIVTHELIHAVTALAMDSASKTSGMMKRFFRVQNDIKAWKALNPKEFAALDASTQQALNIMAEEVLEVPTYGMSNKRVQLVLRRIRSTQRPSSAWSNFIRAMQGLLGVRNSEASVLDDVISATDMAMEMQSFLLAEGSNDQSTNVINLSMAEANNSTSPSYYTTQQIFDALGTRDPDTDPAQTPALQKLLTDIANQLHGPAGAFKEQARKSEAVSPEDVFIKSLATGKMPFASATRVAGFKLNDQQAFVLEQVEATLRASMDISGTNELSRRELGKVWKEAKAAIGPEVFYEGDWSQASSTDAGVIAAKAKHDFLFKMSSENGNAKDHLARFAALAMVDPVLKARMDFASSPAQETQTGRTLSQVLIDTFKKILSVFHGRLTKTFAGQQADQKVWALMDQLVDIEGKRRAREMDNSVTWQDRASDKVDGFKGTIRSKAIEIGRSDYVRNRANNFVGAGATLVSVVAAERTEEVMNNMERVRQNMFTAKQGFIASLVTEARGAHDKGLLTAHSLLRKVSKKNEQERLKLNTVYRQAVLESFENNGKNLTKQQKASITRAVMDTDLVALMNDFNADEMAELVRNPAELKRTIAEYESEIGKINGTFQNYYLGAAQDLGYHMASDSNQSQHLMMNAHNIASLHGLTKYKGKVSEADVAAVTPKLDALISLYALDYTEQVHKDNLLSVMNSENPRGNQSGIQMVLELHKKMQADALEKEFNNNPTQMQKGYRSEIYHSQKSTMTALASDKESYEAMGYQVAENLALDPNDPNQERKALYVIMDGGATRVLSGTVSNLNKAIKGSVSKTTASNNKKLLQERDNYIEDLMANGKNANRGNFKSYLAPVLTSEGDVSEYRYLMSAATKDSVLDRNNAVEDVFGAMASVAFDKQSSLEQNRLVMESLKAQYDEEYAQNPGAFLKVSADSRDPNLAQAYKMMPDETKKLVKELWGKNELMVRGDMIDLHFGYRKLSLADGIQKEATNRRHIEKLHAWMYETIFGKKAYLRARQVGNAWTELVTEVKDILVIKTGLTLIGNVSSNISLLVWHGVPLKELAADHRIAIEGVLNYKRDYTELQKLELNLETGRITDKDAAEQRIFELRDQLKNNPVAVIIDEGLMPTIVEDVDLHEDPYSYKSQLAEKTEKWTGKVWKPIRTVGRYTYMTQDTPVYKALSQGTQISDFVARYTLYKHVTTRKRNRMTHDEAIQRASDMFVNYDVPSHKVMQYLNDIGLLRFTKYYLRIQKPILTLFAEHPARGIMMVLLNSMMPGLDLLNDSQISGQVGNPLQAGALDYPGVLDELATVKAALGLVD